MAMHTETALRLPVWLIAASVVVGVALGLMHMGVFDRFTGGVSGASAHAAAGQLRAVAVSASVGAMAGEPAPARHRANGRADERPVAVIEQLAGDPDMEDRAESDALQAALAAEQASH